MTKTLSQVEKNMSASFGYVKKDMMMLNDAFSDLHEKIQHLSLNHAGLLEEISRLRSEISKLSGGKTPSKPKKKKTSKKVKTVKPKTTSKKINTSKKKKRPVKKKTTTVEYS